MARRDFHHNTVKRALIKDGWTITMEPMFLAFPSTKMEVDLAAEKFILQKGVTQIAVEVKNFFPEKGMNLNELKTSIGQYALYIRAMKRQFPQYKLYLAIPEDAYKNIFSTSLMQEIISDFSMSLLIYSPTSETVVEWKH